MYSVRLNMYPFLKEAAAGRQIYLRIVDVIIFFNMLSRWHTAKQVMTPGGLRVMDLNEKEEVKTPQMRYSFFKFSVV